MGETNYEKEDSLNLKVGCVHLGIFLALIIAGIVTKRVYGHPEFMMLFHGPAAIFLVAGGLKITQKQRRKFKQVRIDEVPID